MNATDPSGREIFVVGDDEYQVQVGLALARLISKSQGREDIMEAENSPYPVIIMRSDGANSTTPLPDLPGGSTYENSRNGVGTGVIVEWNPELQEGTRTANGDSSRPAFMGLGHEVSGHGLDALRGEMDPNQDETADENEARERENALREEHGMDPVAPRARPR